jgi:predicted MPP superfamily phosphohydrolase
MRPSATPALRIGFASDFHAGPTTAMCLLREAADALARARLDVLLLGGDFVSVRARYIGPLARMIEDIPAPLGKFAVLGNHDLRANVDQVVDALEHVGVDVLVNESRRLAAPHSDVVLVGLDDPIRGEPDADAAFADATGLRVVLMHAPDGLFSIGTRPFALAVAGHTHGGQVRLPSGRAPVVPSGRLSRQYLDGMYRIGDKGGAMLVSRGVGCSTIPIRLFARPVVHVITLG